MTGHIRRAFPRLCGRQRRRLGRDNGLKSVKLVYIQGAGVRPLIGVNHYPKVGN
jgi:hypothetical protein